ncbi:MAG: endonuclease III [Acidobacteria bacterium]|jgi:endonuclease-3|nr:endonuclease III [Thermoanaerobaculia bacterium]MDI9631662.1 endonuclease III [Acidobacteriota bacterium]OQC36011.1 MAG: Ultraviolet N-glycosylase/AP lyase [Acidobacteria bacterium ADurb.Bin051]MBP7814200.1 endonuclease III [Thermoanaerobaculia bacterium]MBP8846465.1 endonuclease III [Thermoanaerobaculia bacterium]
MAAPRLKRGGPPRRRESARARRERTATILDRLAREYPDATCALTHANPFQLLVATILSAQCTDEQVNRVTPALFARFPDAAALAGADLAEVEALVHSTGFFRNKARALVGLGQALVADHDGQVPATMAELVRLPGVGRKTANVVLGNAFGRDEGIVVDTHVARLSRRLGLAAGDSPEAIERELMALVPRDAWTLWAHLLIFHGRQVCPARRPRCASCVVADLCPSAEL